MRQVHCRARETERDAAGKRIVYSIYSLLLPETTGRDHSGYTKISDIKKAPRLWGLDKDQRRDLLEHTE